MHYYFSRGTDDYGVREGGGGSLSWCFNLERCFLGRLFFVVEWWTFVNPSEVLLKSLAINTWPPNQRSEQVLFNDFTEFSHIKI